MKVSLFPTWSLLPPARGTESVRTKNDSWLGPSPALIMVLPAATGLQKNSRREILPPGSRPRLRPAPGLHPFTLSWGPTLIPHRGLSLCDGPTSTCPYTTTGVVQASRMKVPNGTRPQKPRPSFQAPPTRFRPTVNRGTSFCFRPRPCFANDRPPR